MRKICLTFFFVFLLIHVYGTKRKTGAGCKYPFFFKESYLQVPNDQKIGDTVMEYRDYPEITYRIIKLDCKGSALVLKKTTDVLYVYHYKKSSKKEVMKITPFSVSDGFQRTEY